MRFLLNLLVLFLLSLSPAWSAPTIDCHCFRDRQFDPHDPSAVDNYVLATCQNSLVAAIFKVDKKPIVKARMSGVTSRQVWISHYLAEKLGKTATDWLDQYARRDEWQAVVADLTPFERQKLGEWFLTSPEASLAETLIARKLAETLAVSSTMLQSMRTSGGDDRSIIAAAVLGRLAEEPPDLLLRSVQEGRQTWGEWVVEVGLEPGDLGRTIQGLVRSSR